MLLSDSEQKTVDCIIEKLDEDVNKDTLNALTEIIFCVVLSDYVKQCTSYSGFLKSVNYLLEAQKSFAYYDNHINLKSKSINKRQMTKMIKIYNSLEG